MEKLPTPAVQTTKQVILKNPMIKSCKECWVEFNTVEDWQFHMVDVHGVKIATMAHGKTNLSNRRCHECWVEFASLKDFMHHMLDVHNKDITRNSKTLSFNKKISSLLRDYHWNRRNKVVLQNKTKRQFCTKCGHCFIDKHEDSQCKILLHLMQSCVVVMTDISRCEKTAEPHSPPESLAAPTSNDSEENCDYDFNISEVQQPTENKVEHLLCDCCGSSFNSLEELKRHLSISLCVHCGTSFNTSEELEQHILTSFCGNSLFDNSSELQQHDAKSLCNNCGASFDCLEEHLSSSLCISVKQELNDEAYDFANDFQNKLLDSEIKVEPSEAENLEEQLQNDFFERELKMEPLEEKNRQEQAYANLLEGDIKVEAPESENVQEQLQNYPYESEIKQESLESQNMQGQLQFVLHSEISIEPETFDEKTQLESENYNEKMQFVLHSEISIEPETLDEKIQLGSENFDGKTQLETENYNEKMQLNILPSHIKNEPESEDEDNQMFPRPLQIELDHEMKTKVLEKAIKTEPDCTAEEIETNLFEHPLRIELEGIQPEMQAKVLEKAIKTEPDCTAEEIETNLFEHPLRIELEGIQPEMQTKVLEKAIKTEPDCTAEEIETNLFQHPLRIELEGIQPEMQDEVLENLIKTEPSSTEEQMQTNIDQQPLKEQDIEYQEIQLEIFHQPLVIVSESEEKYQDVLFNDGQLHEADNIKNKNVLTEEEEENISREPPFKKQCSDLEPNQSIFFCFICLDNLTNGNEVYRHLLDAHKGTHRCKSCHRFLPSIEFFVFHMLCHHKSLCMFCSKGFNSLRPLRLHVMEHIIQVDPDSEWCRFLKSVLEAVKIEGSCYSCPFCKAKFHYLMRLVFHCSVHLKQTKFSSMVSEFKSAFTSEASLLSASVDNSTIKPLMFILNLNPVHPKRIKKRFRKKIVSLPMFECKECEELFQTEKALMKHVCFVSKFTCKLCGISCVSSPAMYDHYLEHSKVGETVIKNICNLCRIGFVEKSILCDHYLEHIQVGDKTCPYCNIAVTDVVTAAKHMKRHFGCGKRLRRCVQCERIFFNERNFYQHLCLDPKEDFLIQQLRTLKIKAAVKDGHSASTKTRVNDEKVILPQKRKLMTVCPNERKLRTVCTNDFKNQYIYCVPQAHYSNTNFGRLIVDLELSKKKDTEPKGNLIPSSSLTLGAFNNYGKRKLLPATPISPISKNLKPAKPAVLFDAAFPNLIGCPQLAKECEVTHSNTVSSSQSLASAFELPIQPKPLPLAPSLPSFAAPELNGQEYQLMPQILKVESLAPFVNCPSMVAVLPQFSSLPLHLVKSEISRLPLILQRK